MHVSAVPDNYDLINGFRNGEEVSVRHLYHLHYRALCYFAEQLVSDKQEAEDIAVESFIKLLQKKTDFNNLSDIKSFLYTTTRNACFDLLRKNKVKDKSNRELEYLAQPDDQFGEAEMITAKVLQTIYAEMENLPSQCRKVFTSIFIEGKTTAAIAEEMGISSQTVLNQKSKALQTLRFALYKEGLLSSGAFFYCLVQVCGRFNG